MLLTINLKPFAGICKLCKIDHLVAVQVEPPGGVLCMEQSEEPTIAQSQELSSVSIPIPEFDSPEPHASSEVGSILEVCFGTLKAKIAHTLLRVIDY